MKGERNIITMDGQGNISLPSDIGATAMTEWEICGLFGAAKVRKVLPERIMHVRKEKTMVFVSVVSDGRKNTDGWRNGWIVNRSVSRLVGWSYERERFSFSTAGKAKQSFPFTKAKQARGSTSAARSGGYAVSR